MRELDSFGKKIGRAALVAKSSVVRLNKHYPPDDIANLRERARDVLKPNSVDTFLRRQVVLYKRDKRKGLTVDNLTTYTNRQISGLESPTAT